MKLYATTTSERASKGQGGNDFLITQIKDKNQDELLTVHITCAKSHLRGEHYNIYVYNPQGEYIAINHNEGFGELEQKGKKQKGELCQVCKNEGKPCACDLPF